MKWFVIISIVCLSIGCRSHKQTAKLKAVRNVKLVEDLSQSQLQYEWFNAKIATTVSNGDAKKSFKTIVKMRKDSVIWVSVAPLLGIEVARIIITPDSLKFIDKIHNEYFKGDLQYLKKERNIDVEFGVLQELLVANALMFDEQEKFKSSKGEENYMITSKTKRKVRKAVGIQNRKDGNVMTMDTVLLDIDERKYARAIEKNGENDLIVKRYWLSPDFARPVKTIITDILYDRIIEADYSDFELQDSLFFPKKVDYKFIDKTTQFNLSLKYNRIRINQVDKFPFTIPKDFSPLSMRDDD